ncbi:MAG: hypothetical protein ACOX69_00575 [Coriobacteriales bacterium]|jgi:hypothetical protein
MQLAVNKNTALYLLRSMRARGASPRYALSRRCNLPTASPHPHKRWSKKGLRAFVRSNKLASTAPLEQVDIAVPSGAPRLYLSIARCSTYGSGLPKRSFVDLGSGLFMSSPELLFVELAPELSLPEHLMLGLELCGGFSRDPDNPIEGDCTFDVQPVTSRERISAFIERCGRLKGVGPARRTLALLADNAWSPTEAAVAVMISLPLEEYGYELGRCVLNPRFSTPKHLQRAAVRESRVPDILIEGTSVGINYDGAVHFDLDSVVSATMALDRDPGSAALSCALTETMNAVRAKLVDDIRRNRELAADGLTVFPVVKEDLYEEGGLDRVMAQVVAALEAHEGVEHPLQRDALASAFASKERQALVRSLIPGPDRELDPSCVEAFVGY